LVSRDDDTTTLAERADDAEAVEATVPVLLLSGPEALPGGSVPRLLPIGDGLVVGRGRDGVAGSQLTLPDRLLSRTHLRIVPRRGYEVEDAGSLNGTYVDGRRLTAPRRLIDGSIISFGHHAAVFRRVTAAEQRAIEAELAAPFGPVATASPGMAVTLEKLRHLARTDAELLLVGETGVGKEVYARAIHEASGRRGPFVAINCAALPAELIESELYGYARGAHSTATEAKRGLVEAADGGTLLLDEIGEMPPMLQVKMFRFLQQKEITPLGAGRPRRVDVRILAATSALGGEGTSVARLRPDLLARLGSDPIVIPPLRDRPEDIGALAASFGAGAIREIDAPAFRALTLYGWPLNVRELEGCIRRAAALTTDGCVRLAHLPAGIAEPPTGGVAVGVRRRPVRTAPNRGELERMLREHRGNVSGLARSLDRKWNVVWRWLVRHELDPERFRE
jgi:transcriptional regulator with PAS, ATPase and Fis domain